MTSTPTVLVANRGEIAVRVLRTLRRMGWRSVAVYSDDDAAALHVRAADVAERLGGGDQPRGYLDIPAIIDAARRSGASLIHPGYGFLSENADFAQACADAGLTFVGPSAEAIRLMGDKIQAKRTVDAAGTPVLPGFAEEPGQELAGVELSAAAAKVGYPLLVKPAAGGGGKGMRRVEKPEDLLAAAAAARREAVAAFGDGTLLAERLVEPARHIEVQILADSHGGVVHLGERECSVQRRHQKIIEEAPSPAIDEAMRAAMGEAAVAAAEACGYVGAGTVEFIVPTDPGRAEAETPGGPVAGSEADAGRDARTAPAERWNPAAGSATEAGAPPTAPPTTEGAARPRSAHRVDTPPFAFLEMNTRLQVEHPVTEAVVAYGGARGVDLVELQLRIAVGERLPFTQRDLGRSGHAVEARIYAEDPARGFLPAGGQVLRLREPSGEHIRVDSGLHEGSAIGSAYDPMLAKVIAWGADRDTALRRLERALGDYTLLGCTSNIAFLRELLRRDEVRAGDLDTGLVERLGDALLTPPPPALLAAAALDRHLALLPAPAAAERFDIPDGWRVGRPAWTVWRLTVSGGEPVPVRVRLADDPAAAVFEVAVGDDTPVRARAWRSGDDRELQMEHAGVFHSFARAAVNGELWLGLGGAAWHVKEEARVSPLRRGTQSADPMVRSPMPGTVISVEVKADQRVSAGQVLAVVEAMKMEHAVTSPVDGVVARLDARPGQSVAMDAVLAVVTADAPSTAVAQP